MITYKEIVLLIVQTLSISQVNAELIITDKCMSYMYTPKAEVVESFCEEVWTKPYTYNPLG